MTVIIAHGQPKSGSTFLFQVAKRAAILRGGETEGPYRARLGDILGRPFVDFEAAIAPDLVALFLSRLPAGRHVVLKTHGPLDPALAPEIATGRVRLFTSVRDVRDTALSMVDTGVRDRAKGAARTYFQHMRTPTTPRTIAAQRDNVATLRQYAGTRRCLVIPHEAMAARQDRAVAALLRHLGMRAELEAVVRHFSTRPHERITEFHVGEAFRFARTLTGEEIAHLNRTLQPEIALVDAIIRAAMGRFSLLCAYYALRRRYGPVLAL